mgnify:FL=1
MLKPEQLTLRHVLTDAAEKYADKDCLAYVDSHPISYAELMDKVASQAQILLDKGIAPGDRIAILSENCPNWGIAYLAITTTGAVAVPILPDFHANEVHNILKQSQAKGIFISGKLMPNITGINRKEVLVISTDDMKIESEIKQTTRLKLNYQDLEVAEDDLAAIIFTSGTTGHSKGVMLTHKNIVANAIDGGNSFVDLREDERLVSLLPLSHTYECTLGFVLPLLIGASIHYIEGKPVPSTLMAAMQKVKPTIVFSIPLIIEKIFKLRILPQLKKSAITRGLYKFDFPRKKLHQIAGKKLLESFGGHIRLFGIGGAPLSQKTERFLIDAGFPYYCAYGLTESSPLVTGASENRRLGSVGQILPTVEAKIEKKHPEQTEGELYIKGPSIMRGYYEDQDTTAEVLSEDGWLKTGDLCHIDDDNYLYIHGRSKNMILGPSGENIYPEEIESILLSHRYVVESIVFEHETKVVARVHPDYEQLQKEFDEQNLSLQQRKKRMSQIMDEIKTETNEQLSSFSRINRVIEQEEPFAKTPTQKIKRYLYVT